ncbi:phage late control D family protein [Desulfobaculum senezii]
MGLDRKLYAPAFRVVANGSDITSAIRERLASLSITDEAGMQSDALSITLADTAPHIRLPATGAELRVWLGYGDRARYMGLYVVDGLTLSGPPGQLAITASGAPFEKSGTYSQLQTQRTRSWTPGTVGDVVRTIAAEHGLAPAIAEDVAGEPLGHLDQIGESDMNLLTRVAADMGMVAKANGGALVFVKKGEGKTASGKPLHTVTLTPEDVTNWSVDITERAAYRRVIATWRDKDAAQDVDETVGEGEPAFRIRHTYPSRKAATKAARAKLEAFQKGKQTVTLTLPGRPDLQAECKMELRGFRHGIAGTWSATKVAHRLGGAGFVSEVEGEVCA